MEVKQTPFTEVLSNIVDNRGRSCPTTESGVPLIATNCIRNDQLYPSFDKARYVSANTYAEWFRGHPEPGDLIFVCKGTPGRVCMTPDPVSFCIAQDMVAVRANPKKIYPKYLFALLRSQDVQTQISNMHVGTMIPHFKKGDFDKILLPIPDNATQKAIGDIYFELSAKIELNRRMNETLEAMARALFKSWFIDFDPVRAKADGRKPEGMDEATAKLFPDSFEESDRGAIPRDWVATTVGEVFDLTMGQSPPGETYNEFGEGTPFYQGRTDFGFRYPTRRMYCTAPTRFAKPGDTLVSVRAPVGDINLSIELCCIGRGVAAVRHRSHSRSFTYYAMNAQSEAFAYFEADGTVFGAINKQGFMGIPVVEPSMSVLQAFERLSFPLDQRIECNSTEIATLTGLRDTLLPKLLSGELRIKDAERFVENTL